MKQVFGKQLVVFWVLFFCSFLSFNTSAQIVTIPIPGSPLSLNVMANPQPLQNINTNPASSAYQLYDDGYANVPLPFTFPFFDKTFNNSTMYSNGTVQFGPHVPTNNTFCCNGITIDRNTPSAYNYSILMMQTDLFGATGTNHYSLGTTNSMTYGWYGVERLGVPQNKTSFELKIDSTGGIDMRWTGALITMNTPAIGVIGDASKGEFAVIQQGSLYQNFTIPGLTQITTGQTPDIVIDPCTSNPLYSATCPGYQAAYTEQQCSANPLYSISCSGYQAAYTTQQCSINPLYSATCPGYASAYFNQQCSTNALYDINCPGYATAYLNLQCSTNPLYSTTCSGYAAAYFDQQCSLNPLHSTTCPGYEQAYLNSQCIIDSLFSNKCEGYATAYAIKYLIKGIDSTAVNSSLSSTAATKANDPISTIVSTNTASTKVNSDGTVTTGVSATGDINIDKAIAAPSPSTNSSSAPAAAVQLTRPPEQSSPAAPMAEQRQERKQEQKEEQKQERSSNNEPGGDKPSGGTQSAKNDSGGEKPKPTARQEIQAKREAAAKAKAVETDKNLANEMGKASNMESQVAVQNVVIQAMGYSPAFEAYKVMMPDVPGYKPYTIYGNQKNIDNRNLGRGLFGATDQLHNDMVNSQYK